MPRSSSLPAGAPGPTRPPFLQALAWTYRPIPLLEECARRFGDVFTLRMPVFGTFFVFHAPGAIKEIFTGDPRALHAGRANELLTPIVGQSSPPRGRSSRPGHGSSLISTR